VKAKIAPRIVRFRPARAKPLGFDGACVKFVRRSDGRGWVCLEDTLRRPKKKPTRRT
jgi:hypothetical protein